jgi:ferredoxin-NADP reductase/nitrite reductase/ring-hydroxylating ferredoxin subunit
MSGCPSSCAQHFTADIGLKGVRVRRLLGTREGFDVYLGGGIAGQVHLGLPYKLGVDVDQLPQLVEDVVQEYYLRHKPGMTFSAYWREKLRDSAAAKVGDGEYTPPTWLCEACQYRHKGEDPPVYCPKCAGLRRNFARLEAGTEAIANGAVPAAAPPRSDGFALAAQESQLAEGAGLTVEVEGKEYALFRIDGRIHALDNACPHEGAPLAQGEIADGVITCPWHGWTFQTCTGCSINPAGNDVKSYPVKVEEGQIFIQTGTAKPVTVAAPTRTTPAASGHRPAAAKPAMPKLATLNVVEVIQETPDVKTFRLDNSRGDIPCHRPGQFVKVRARLDGREVWRSFTISSSPTTPERLDLTIKRNPAGELSNHLHDAVEPGCELTVKGPQGGFFFNPDAHCEPLVLISAGSGITPMMSILRYLADTGSPLACTFLHGARTLADIIFHDECRRLATSLSQLKYLVALSQPVDAWDGLRGRLSFEMVRDSVGDLTGSRYFLCGPGDFMQTLQQSLVAARVPAARIHTEQFHKSEIRNPDSGTHASSRRA